MNKTSIEWVRTYRPDGTFEEGHTVNPIRFRPRGSDRTVTMCQKISPGCKHCYAESITRRFWPKSAGPFPGYTAQGLLAGDFVMDEKMLLSVLRHKKPTKIFWGDMTDLFQDGIPDLFLDQCFAVCALTPHITHIFLTKRPARMLKYMRHPYREDGTLLFVEKYGVTADQVSLAQNWIRAWPLPNVQLGASVENQKAADERIPLVLQTPAAVRFISAEPLLELVTLAKPIFILDEREPLPPRLDWVICGGESGPGARPMHPDWARGLRDQCVAAGVPFFFKQWGSYGPTGHPGEDAISVCADDGWFGPMIHRTLDEHARERHQGEMPCPPFAAMYRASKYDHAALLDGREWKQFPEVRSC